MSRDSKTPLYPPSKPLFIVLSGLSGVGKDTVLAGLRKAGLPAHICITATTRQPRSEEKDGVDYFFVSKSKFQEMLDKDELMENATVYGNSYGIPKEPVRKALKSGQDVIARIDVQGAATIKKNFPPAVLVFLVTTTINELEKRLKQRRTETAAELELRLKTAEKELDSIPLFDYVVVNRNGEIDRTIEDIKAIITAEKCRAVPRELNI